MGNCRSTGRTKGSFPCDDKESQNSSSISNMTASFNSSISSSIHMNNSLPAKLIGSMPKGATASFNLFVPIIVTNNWSSNASSYSMSHGAELFRCVAHGKWPDAIKRAKTHREEGKYVDENGYTALHMACKCYLLTPLKLINALLTSYPSATTLQDKDGNTPLHLACRYSSIGVVKALLSDIYVSPIHIKNNHGRTPLEEMTNEYKYEIITSLELPNGSQLTPADDQGHPNEVYECYEHYMGKAVLLIKKQYSHSNDFQMPKRKIWRLLHASVGISNAPFDFLKLVVKLYPNQVKEIDEDGNLPLHIAAVLPPSMHKNNIFLYLFYAFPIAICMKNNDGKTPLQLNDKCGNTDIFDVLSKAWDRNLFGFGRMHIIDLLRAIDGNDENKNLPYLDGSAAIGN